jgi:phosphoribosylformylglycinamidine cyclo-ligase
MPLIKSILDQGIKVNGMIHCSGGGQTKVMKFVKNNVRLIKNNLLAVPPLFQIIQSESGASTKEMFEVFNMGHRLEIYTQSKADAMKMIEISNSFAIDADIIGHVTKSTKPELQIDYNGGSYLWI